MVLNRRAGEVGTLRMTDVFGTTAWPIKAFIMILQIGWARDIKSTWIKQILDRRGDWATDPSRSDPIDLPPLVGSKRPPGTSLMDIFLSTASVCGVGGVAYAMADISIGDVELDHPWRLHAHS